jgi:hypothetical protein
MRTSYLDIFLTAVFAIPAFFLMLQYGKDKETVPEYPPWEVPEKNNLAFVNGKPVLMDDAEYAAFSEQQFNEIVEFNNLVESLRPTFPKFAPPDPTFDNGLKVITDEIYNVKKEKGKYMWTGEQIFAIQNMEARGSKVSDIAKLFNVSPKSIRRVLTKYPD